MTSRIIDELAKFSWQEKKSVEDYKDSLKQLKQSYQKFEAHVKLINFYEKNWLPFLIDGTIFIKT